MSYAGTRRFRRRSTGSISRLSRFSRAVLTSVAPLSALAIGASSASAINSTWLGGTGSWGLGANWSTSPDYPHNFSSNSYDVFIDGGKPVASTVALNFGNNSTTTLHTLAISSGDVLNIGPTDRLRLDGPTLVNAGTITLNATGVFTALQLPNVTLSGGGTVTMGNNAENHIRGETAGARFTNLDNLIQGSGRIAGDQSLAITNSGTILANQAVPLTIQPGAGTQNVNTGTMAARNGEMIVSGTFNNSGGTFLAGASGAVTLSNSLRLFNGTLRTESGGVIRSGIAGSTPSSASIPRLIDLINNGNVAISGGNDLAIAGTIVNVGSINLFSEATSTPKNDLVVVGTATLTGGGTVNTASLNGRILGTAATDRLINQNNTISGGGNLGNGSMNFTNRGTVVATAGQTLIVLPSTESLNDVGGTMRAASGGELEFTGGSHVNNGTVVVDSGGTLTLFKSAALSGNGVRNDGYFNVSDGTADVASVAGSGTTTVGNFSSLRTGRVRDNALTISGSGSATIAAGGGTLGTSVPSSLSIAPGGKLDLNDHNLVVRNGSLSNVTALVRSGLDAPTFDWLGPGIRSTAAHDRNQTAGALLVGLGMLSGSEYATLASSTTFDGFAVAPPDVLVKYTWMGDANFSGTVGFDDYVRIDAGFNTHLTGWANGDFNYDGVVSFDDYVIIDIAFNAQSGTLGRAIDWVSGDDRTLDGSGRTATGVEAVIGHFEQFGSPYAQRFLAGVPEPTCCAAVAMVGALSLRRRRSR